MKLYEALDPQTQQVLCTEAGVLDFLKSFPPQWQQRMATIVPKALDAPVGDDISPDEALSLFTYLTGKELAAAMALSEQDATVVPFKGPKPS